ncbi:helix-turn-helix domain-containing protein [Flavobacterium sp.]
MLYFNFSRFFKLKGIVRPFSYLTKNGYSSGYATKITNNRVKEINLERLEKFCTDFNCTPNDVFDFRSNTNDNLPKDHALHTITKTEINNEVIDKINAMSAEKMQQIHDIIKNME